MGRGSSGIGAGAWKKALKGYAARGEMPATIMGNREQQSAVFKEIDKLYSMPDTKARIVDQGANVWVSMQGKVYRQGYPSGENATEEEKRGVLKWLLYNRNVKG